MTDPAPTGALGPECKAERLALAGVLAPFLREGASRAARRRVGRLGPNGEVLGYTTLLEVQKALVAKHALEVEVQPDVKPVEVPCTQCGRPMAKAKGKGSGTKKDVCDTCRGVTYKCSTPGCDASPPKGAFGTIAVRRRKALPWCCLACAKKPVDVPCTQCGQPMVKAQGRASSTGKDICHACRGVTDKCSTPGCDAEPPRGAFAPAIIRARKGAPWRCKPCSMRDPERRARVSSAGRRRFSDPQALAAHSQAIKRAFENPEVRANHGAAVRNAVRDAEYRAKQGEASRRRYQDPEYRDKHAAAVRTACQDPDWLARNRRPKPRKKATPE